MAVNKEAAIKLIVSELRKGNNKTDIFAKICEKMRMSSRTYDDCFKIAKETYINEQQAINEAKADIIKEAAIETLKNEILSVEERKEILSQIAKGEIPLTKPMVVNNEIIEVPIVPDWMDRRNAIAELNKMDGSYSATKTESTVTVTGNILNIDPLNG
jgi:hypothetical protein